MLRACKFPATIRLLAISSVWKPGREMVASAAAPKAKVALSLTRSKLVAWGMEGAPVDGFDVGKMLGNLVGAEGVALGRKLVGEEVKL